MPSCCGDGQFCDFPWCDCDGNAQFRQAHSMKTEGDAAQDCGKSWCNYCAQVVRKKPTSGVPSDLKASADAVTRNGEPQ